MIVLTLAVTVAACFLLRNPIKIAPVAFYVVAVLVDVLFIWAVTANAERSIQLAFYWPMRKCLVALGIFVVVMFIGALPKESKVAQWLRPIRGELSIIGWLLTLGHVAVYLSSYVSPLFSGVPLKTTLVTSMAVAVVLLVLLIILGFTSFNFVKHRMHARTWKSIQRLAYPFFALTYAHLVLILVPGALSGNSATPALSITVYTVVFGAYLILRSRRAVIEKRETSTAAS